MVKVSLIPSNTIVIGPGISMQRISLPFSTFNCYHFILKEEKKSLETIFLKN